LCSFKLRGLIEQLLLLLLLKLLLLKKIEMKLVELKPELLLVFSCSEARTTRLLTSLCKC
jgi:hypothetical protein